jgi:hypothetical protein
VLTAQRQWAGRSTNEACENLPRRRSFRRGTDQRPFLFEVCRLPADLVRACSHAASTAIYRVGQQNIPRRATPSAISGIDLEHTADHDWTRPVH